MTLTRTLLDNIPRRLPLLLWDLHPRRPQLRLVQLLHYKIYIKRTCRQRHLLTLLRPRETPHLLHPLRVRSLRITMVLKTQEDPP
jgi:hypothetical protein